MSRVRLLNHARDLILSNSEEAKAASKKAYDIKTSRKLYSPWRGIYTIIEKTNVLIYKLRKKGGRMKIAHINRIKYYDPENSQSDKDTKISHEDDLDAEIQPTPSGRTTRSTTNTLPPPINRYTATVGKDHNTAVANTRQYPIDPSSLWVSNNTPKNNAFKL